MSINFKLEAQSRTVSGKGASRRLRREKLVPAVVYGGEAEPQMISLPANVVDRNLLEEAFYSHVLTLTVEGSSQQVILRDLQRHPHKAQILHMDFQRVSADQPIHVQVPLHFINEEACVGVKMGGGKISHAMTELDVTCLPKDLPEFIEVDLINVNVGESLHISDLTLPAGVTSVALSHGSEHDLAIATVHGKGGAASSEDDAEEATEE